ncbi:hypothetical protein EHQ83_15530 [Leptospira yasudae]|uniref:Uncharacterized protein n=1 Tax=Leptospira yasudae TaxID=2202201 RepID=A0A6N4QJJ6_9LEPT|nr:hypothetical protein EHQ72_16850 [Leptospira yasudae]TGL77855.1 hypothetical protein EHQ77_14755 [Leptospira yasudae]TGL81262.1 hypothetical protein EHQ83_15530 [Leptospira yasudae]
MEFRSKWIRAPLFAWPQKGRARRDFAFARSFGLLRIALISGANFIVVEDFVVVPTLLKFKKIFVFRAPRKDHTEPFPAWELYCSIRISASNRVSRKTRRS